MKLIRFIGLLVGSVVCSVVFGCVGFFTGLCFPWFNDFNRDPWNKGEEK